MFMIDQRIIPLDTPFTVGEGDEAIQYPANWLRLASAEEKAAIGITEVDDPVRADDRFYWNGDLNTPRPVDDVKKVLIDQVNQTAYTLLLPSDWKLVRQIETSTACDAETLTKRAAIRTACSANIAALNAAIDIAALQAVVLSWPED